ncbi:hypothetical protein FSP39_007698 [Pinctada imbricata]|uniref:Cadherin domain-containing protein n=1 Tax=Pinctada imbricata TaxID=66713 RepID=A0AA88XQG0_PINIB|nr:hypothetical protein FSP39_007698 [Pinctada imbricata]
MTAFDEDTGDLGKITYSLSGSGDSITKFTIDPKTGDIKVAGPLVNNTSIDFGKTTADIAMELENNFTRRYRFDVIASDSDKKERRQTVIPIEVHVLDENVNAPFVFYPQPNSKYPVTISENFPTKQMVFDVEDVNNNGPVFSKSNYGYSVSEGLTGTLPGLWASDISNLLVQEIKELPDQSGFAFKHTYSKTLRGGDGKNNTFAIKRCEDKLICPIRAVEKYVQWSSKWGVNLTNGFLFRLVSENGIVLEDAVTYSAIYERLKYYLQILGIDEGETPHSLRAGCAVTLAISKENTAKDIMSHIGWSSLKMANYYSRASQLKDACNVAEELAKRNIEDAAEIYAEFGSTENLSNAFGSGQ